MREIHLLLLFFLSSIHCALWEDGSRSASSETEETTNSDVLPRMDFVRITRASGERHERQISRRLEAFGDGGERHMITVDRNGNILQFRRPPFFSLQQPLSSFRQSPFFQRGFTRPRSSHGFSRRRPIPPLSTPFTPSTPKITRPTTTTVTHDGSMTSDEFLPSEDILQSPTVTREGTVTNEFRRIPSRTQPSLTGRIDSLRLIHGGSMERGLDRSMERVTVSRRIGSRPPRPLRISSSFEVLPNRENDRFRIGGPPFGEITTPVPSPRVFIQTPSPLRPRPPPPRQRPQPPRRVEALSNDEQEFIPSGRSPVSPSVVVPFRSFRPRLPSTRFTLPPRSQFRSGFTPIHTSPLATPLSSSSTTFTTSDPSTTIQTTTPTTTTVTDTTTTQSTTPSTTTIIEDTTTTLGTTQGTTATTSRPTISSLSTTTSRRPTVSIATTSRFTTRPSTPTTPRPKLTSPRTDQTTVLKTTASIGKTAIEPKMTTVSKITTVSRMTTVSPTVSRVTPPPTTAKTRRTGTTRGLATVSPSISVKVLPPTIPDDLSFNGIRGPLPPSPLPSLQPHSTTSRPPSHSGAPSFPPSSSFDGPPGEMPPSDNIVQMLNEADDFLDMAKRLNITRKARIARRRRRMAEYSRWRW